MKKCQIPPLTSWILVIALCLSFCGCSTSLSPSTDSAVEKSSQTPLDEYVAKPDPAFTYDPKPAREDQKDAYTARTYHLVSQEWLDTTKVDRTKWEHWVIVVIPKEVKYNQTLLFIGGGGNGGQDVPEADGMLAQVAVMTKSILVEIKQIPNQPLHFTEEKDEQYKESGRKEDSLIAYGWDKFLVTQDPIWLARLPMTKAVVRAMDLVQKEYPQITGFFVCGGSKRGWTTWTTAAVDKRVVGIAPAVIDVLNVAKSLDNHFAAYGFWAPAVGNYDEMHIMDRMHTPEFKALEAVVDPYSYIDRLTMPKYIINAAGDQFFPPDSWKFYFDDLKGEKYLRYIPNTDHGLSPEAYFNMASFYNAVLTNTPRPKFTWSKGADGSLEVRCEDKPTQVLLWQATNPEGRDFRLEKIGKAYVSSPAEETEPGVYRAAIQAPEKGYTAFLLEMEFPNPGFQSPFKFTTGISIVPDTYPGAK
ncbi:MAG: PhoPQ-activated pathogenicity-related family protein [Candidatus Hydrogenedentes bacterium]|nr:PhoPQ-activated pathogenicity-related family protein [Candidatus Hydrogenedentota bacterium]